MRGSDSRTTAAPQGAVTGVTLPVVVAPEGRLRLGDLRALVRRNPTVVVGSALLLAIVLMAISAPWIAPGDPQAISPATSSTTKTPETIGHFAIRRLPMPGMPSARWYPVW